jgi:N utilization substance protein B
VAALDAIIARLAARGVDQLDAVGRAILLLALAELKYRDDVPTKVVINEGVELAKRYGATDSFRFVNAVLDKASRELRAAAAVPGTPV